MNVPRLRFCFAALIGLVSLPIAGCDTNPPAQPQPRPGIGGWSGQGGATTAHSSAPAGFLATDYEPLSRWLDERFEVKYRNLTPDMIFDKEPIADIRYETNDLPKGAPLFHLESADMSRREILHRVAEFWSLDMTIEAENGTPSYVRVNGR